MESMKDFLDLWLKSQERVYISFTDMTQRFQKAIQGVAEGGMQTPGFRGLQDLYASWTQSIMNALQSGGGKDSPFMKEFLAKTATGSGAYVKLYEMWLPLFKAIQERSASPDSLKDFIDPARYKEMLDRIFSFDPFAASRITEQVGQLLGTLSGSSQSFIKTWRDATEKSAKTFPSVMEGHPEALMKIFHTVFSAFDSTIGRAFHVPAVGKDREKIELLLRSLDDISVCLATQIEYEHMMFVTGITAYEKVIETVADKMRKGEEFKTFEEFFDLWIDVNEKAFYALFQTEGFSKKQGELLEASLNVRKHFFKLMELYLYDFPIALRSEMDDLYKTIYDLKKKVKSLEKQIEEVRA